MEEEDRSVLRTIYVAPEVDMMVRQLAFTEGKSASDIYWEAIKEGLIGFNADGRTSMADEMMENRRLRIEFRTKKLAELESLVDKEFDARWKRLKVALNAALASLDEGEG